jgi:uncharacterized protein YwgA
VGNMVLKDLALLLETIRQAKTVYCRTRIQKMVFLGIKEEGLPYTYKFTKHYYGPFCAELTGSLSLLVADGALEEQSVAYPFVGKYGQVVEHRYILTPFGMELLKVYSNELMESEKRKIKNLSERFDEMSLDKLISYVYSKYLGVKT